MAKKAPYKGSKSKVETLVNKMIKDNMYDPNEEELDRKSTRLNSSHW